jgi:hypothetical protein
LAAQEPLPPLASYLGSEGCKPCHEKKYDGWKRTFHSTVVQDAKKDPSVILGDFTQTGIGFTKEDVEFTIGKHWNQRYMKKFSDDYYILPKLWSTSSNRWEPNNVWGWRKMPYSKYCVGCHATRYDPSDGSMVEHTIGCETCHGPGRAHAEAEGKGSIIHPGKLGGVEMEMICASCHVRGKDLTGNYHFPVGFVPGRNLAEYYVPEKAEPGEPVSDALLRLFRKWWSSAGSEDAQCEVCGVYGDKSTREVKSMTDYCKGCHKFGDDLSKHTKHKPETKFECFDCHKKVSVEPDESQEDVHSISYFLVHKKSCYDREFSTACRVCHQAFTVDMVKEKLDLWKGMQSVHE